MLLIQFYKKFKKCQNAMVVLMMVLFITRLFFIIVISGYSKVKMMNAQLLGIKWPSKEIYVLSPFRRYFNP